MRCICGHNELGIIYRQQELDKFYCKDCGQVYQWTGSQLAQVHGYWLFIKEVGE